MAERYGGITLQEIADAAHELPFPENAGASPSERFVLKISALVTVRQAQGENGGIAVFLQSPSLQSDIQGQTGAQFNPIIATGNDPIASRVWLSNASLGGAYALNIDCGEPSVVVDAICSVGFGDLPAFLIDWRGAVPAGRFYSRGLSNLDHVQEVALAYEEITEQDLKLCLDNFHRTSLATPLRTREGHAPAVWTDAGAGIPAHRPEERIQAKLIEHLRSRYSKHVVRAEPKNDDGITDLVIFAHTTDTAGSKIIVKEWALEMKALTDRTESGNAIPASDTRNRIEEGITQAIAYRDKEHARKAALCCYDMRRDDEGDDACFSAVQGEARNEGILLWRWFLFRSSGALRTFERAVRNSSTALQH